MPEELNWLWEEVCFDSVVIVFVRIVYRIFILGVSTIVGSRVFDYFEESYKQSILNNTWSRNFKGNVLKYRENIYIWTTHHNQ